MLRHTTRVTGSFSYEAVLPAPVDEKKVTAVLADGVLDHHAEGHRGQDHAHHREE